MRYLVPFKKDKFPDGMHFMQSFEHRTLPHPAESQILYLAVESDADVDMEVAYTALYAFVHNNQYPETHDFFFSADLNHFRHEESGTFYTAFKPFKDDSTEAIGVINEQQIKAFSFKLMQNEIKNRKAS